MKTLKMVDSFFSIVMVIGIAMMGTAVFGGLALYLLKSGLVG